MDENHCVCELVCIISIWLSMYHLCGCWTLVELCMYKGLISKDGEGHFRVDFLSARPLLFKAGPGTWSSVVL